MASLKYRTLELNPKVVTKPVAASQYFYQDGVNLVFLDGNGRASLALTATTNIYGYALVPKGQGAGTIAGAWLSSSTAGKDEIQIIPISGNEGATFLMPASEAVTDVDIGNACDIAAVNDGSATKVTPKLSVTDVLIIEDLGTAVAGGSSTDVIVKFNPAKVQADT